MIPATREQLQQYALNRLGAPVIEINIANEQMDDRMDDALRFFQDFHFDGTQRVYLKHQVTGSTVALTSPVASYFTPSEIIMGQASGVGFVNYGPLPMNVPVPAPNILTTRF